MSEELLRVLTEIRSLVALPTILTVRHAAREMSVGVSTLKGLIRRGEIDVCRVGKRVMIPSSEIYRLAQPGAGTTAGPQTAGSRTRRPARPKSHGDAIRELAKKGH